MIEITHNFEPRRFKWLWAKYVRGVNASHHCTNSLRGPYSKKFSKLNTSLEPVLRFDEEPEGSYGAVYLCGVASRGYAKHLNYPHNVHLAIQPEAGIEDDWAFEDWHVTVTNGRVLQIPGEEQLPEQYRGLPASYTTCRIFRWAVCSRELVRLR